MDNTKFPMGMFHMSDLWKPQNYSDDKCCFIYGSGGRSDGMLPTQCDKPVTIIIKSKLRTANVCDYHKDEILRHHLQFDPEAIANKI